jgi:hypothetical protein
MELDELKASLNKHLEQPAAPLEAWGLERAMQGKTRSVLSKLKRSVWIEIIASVLFLALFVYEALFSEWRVMRIYFGTFSVLFLIFLPILVVLLKRITALQGNSLPVKSSLQKLTSILREYVKRYFQFTMALIPICIVYAGSLSYMDDSSYRNPQMEAMVSNVFTSSTQVLVFLGVYLIVLAAGIYFFTKWYLNRLYGRYINDLEKHIAELESAD